MSRRPDRMPQLLMQLPVMLLLSLGIGLPLLHAADLTHFIGQYLCISAAVSVLCSLFSLRRRLLPLAFLAFILSQALLFFFGAGFLFDLVQCFKVLRLSLSGADTALYLYGDLLCTQLAVWLTLITFLLSSPDNGLYLPVFGAAALLTLEWMLGVHRSSLYMLPVLPALLIHYAAVHRKEAADQEHAPHAASPFILPLAGVLLSLSLLLAPADGFKVEPFASMTQKLRDAIDDHFFFTEERARYTLASDGWMPLGQTQLGGEAAPSERDVMLVETDETAYLRGAILDTYTGGMWYDSVSSRRYGWNAAHYRTIRDTLFEAAYPLLSAPEEETLTVTVLSSGASTLFTPQRIRTLSLGDSMVGYFNTGTEIFITRNLAANDRYSVRYLSMKATDSGMSALVQQHAAADDPAYQQMLSTYTKLPSHIQQEVFDIAALATQHADTPWEKAVAIRDYLKKNYAYSLQVKDPPESVDFVAWFLLAEQKGYCTYFATAMTVLCRIANLPARYVEGYIAKPDASGLAHVTGLDAHAWTEVYLNGVGWVTFDATAIADEPDLSGENPLPPQEEAASPTPQPESPATPSPIPEASSTPTSEPDAQQDASTPSPAPGSPDENDHLSSDPNDLPTLPWLLLLLIIALVILLAVRIRITHPLYRAQRAKNDTHALLILWQAALACAACLRIRQDAAETPLQFAARAEKELATRMYDVAEAVSAVHYGRHPAPQEALPRARDIYLTLEERLSVASKLRLSLRRALSFGKKP